MALRELATGSTAALEANMIRSAAVVAHFDANDRLEDNFRLLLSCLEQVFDSVVLVTTCNLPDTETAQFDKVITIRRPNIGYDFYSYRVGLSYLDENMEVDNILLVNSSFVIVDCSAFTRMLQKMLKLSLDYDAVGITESQQIHWHLQSYLLLLSNRLLKSDWFKGFFENIQPLNTKLEIILSYEIGLSRALLSNNVKTLALFKPNALQNFLGEIYWMRVVARNSRWRDLLLGKPWQHRREVNWTHFGAKAIAQQFGFVKTEILRTNPHGISTNFVSRLSNPAVSASIATLLDNSRSQYQGGKDGLTTFVSKSLSLPASRAVQYGSAASEGVRVAVVVHLFYYDLLDEICTYLRGIVEPFDLYVTTPFEGDVHKIINATSTLAQSVTVWLTENRGRDVGPFIALYLSGALDGYLAVLKLHSKKSKYSSNGAAWRKQIYGSLMGDSLIIRRTINLFESKEVGVVGPHQFYLSHDSFWGANRDTVKNLLTLTGTIESDAEPELGFFAGSMFWFAPEALQSLRKIPVEEFKFEPESGVQDGTLAHSIERIFCSIAKSTGYKVTSVPLAGGDVSESNTLENRVPVL